MSSARISLAESLRADPAATPALIETLEALAAVAATLSRIISLGPLGGALAAEVGKNADGDAQKALDVLADDAFAAALRAAPVRWYASEERERAEALNPVGTLALAIDPLDGSSNIDANVSVGTIFSIYPALPDASASFLRPGREQIAAGYVIYGPQTTLVLAIGPRAALFVLDRDAGVFALADPAVRAPETSAEFAINASNYRHWAQPVRAYIDDCVAGAEGPRGRNFNMRWVASLVAEAHRILVRGGVFLYPADARPGYERGRLRMVYECAPIAYVMEAAGARATDATERMLDQTPDDLHARTPFVFGCADKVARIAAYHDLPAHETSPLFGKRGLFSA